MSGAFNEENWRLAKHSYLGFSSSDVEGSCGCDGEYCTHSCRYSWVIDYGLVCTHPKHPINTAPYEELVARAVLEDL